MDTAKEIFETARANGMPVALANFIVSQARHETADFTSPVFRDCNNAFGYKYKGQKLAAGACRMSPEGDPYAKYLTVSDSVLELVAWIRRRQNEKIFPANLASIDTSDKYAQLLKLTGYYGAPLAVYSKRLRELAVNYGAPIAVGGLALLVLAWLFYKIQNK